MGEAGVPQKAQSASHLIFGEGAPALQPGLLEQGEDPHHRGIGEEPLPEQLLLLRAQGPPLPALLLRPHGGLEGGPQLRQAVALPGPVQLRHAGGADRLDAAPGVPRPSAGEISPGGPLVADGTHQLVVAQPLGGDQVYRVPDRREVGGVLHPAIVGHQGALPGIGACHHRLTPPSGRSGCTGGSGS